MKEILTKSITKLTNQEIGEIISGEKEHWLQYTSEADMFAGYLMYRMFKPVLSYLIGSILLGTVAGYGSAKLHDPFVNNTEMGKKIGDIEKKIANSDTYIQFSKACEMVGAFRY
jgi:hypothetical protein